ncbi:uncharacterized protein LOC129989409 [Argiope bruennichi]|uniref:uncharacterized protein LOC129989409 n=1 Tax=Argiope bruennichi TaxID=94029 RepID=UPI0024947437|nr:uncharacterized protein LOC129989409 [Argiope bruennichi]
MARITNKNCQREAHFTFIWIIENGSALLVPNYVKSPEFTVRSMERTKWMLSLETVSDFESFEIYINRRDDNGPDSIQMEFELSLLDINGIPLKMESSKTELKKKADLKLFDHEVLNQSRAEILSNDALTVRCRMWRTGAEALKSEMCFARTCMGMDRRSFIWAIREFSSIQQEEKRTYYLNPRSRGSPQLVLNLFLSEKEGENYVNIEISRNDTTKSHFILCRISLLDNYGRVVHSKKTVSFACANYKEIDTIQFYSKEKLMTDKSSLLQNDVLFLRCEFQVETEPIWSGIENYRYLNLENLQQETIEMRQMQLTIPNECCTSGCPFKKTLEVMHGDENLSDVTLQAGGKSLQQETTEENLQQGTTEMRQMQLAIPKECCTSGCPFKKTLEVMHGDENLNDVTLRAGGKSLQQETTEENLQQETTEMRQMQLAIPKECCTSGCPFKKTLEVMHGDENLSDVTLRADGKSLPAHKSVLSARSPVFKVMFTHDMREKTSKIVDIPDFNADTVGCLLLYIYKNTVENLEWEGVVDLFRAADKYQLLDLKKKCSIILKSNFSVSSVCTILSLADMHEERDLLKAAEDFISRHDNEVFDSDEWKTLKEENFHLAMEVMERIIRLGKQKIY